MNAVLFVVLSHEVISKSVSPGLQRRRIGRGTVILWLVFAAALIVLALFLDDTVEQLTSVKSMPHLLGFAWFMSKAGEGWVIALAGCGAAIVLARRGRHAAARWVLIAAIVGLATGLAATVLRSLTGRTRPSAPVAQGFYGPWHNRLIIGRFEYSSFPSGHAATVFGLATAVWIASRRIGIIAFAYAALVSWSRVAQGSHHFSDVVAATLLGIFGAHLILARWGPNLDALALRVQNACLRGRSPAAR